MWAFLLTLLFFASPAVAFDWPTNVVNVTNSTTDAQCTGLDTPRECCHGGASDPLNDCDRWGGEDILDGLVACQEAGGCILKLPCNTVFENAEVNIHAQSNDTTDDRHGIIFNTGFPNGLVIQGCGDSTVLRSKIPPARMQWPSAAIIYMNNWNPTGTPEADWGIPAIALRDFQCDGQTPLQPSSHHSDPTKQWDDINGDGVDDQIPTFHMCFQTRWFEYGTPYIEIKNVWAHHFAGTGVEIGRASSATVVNNRIDHIGCWNDFNSDYCEAGQGFNAQCTGPGQPQACCVAKELGTCHPFLCCTGAGTGTCESTWYGGEVAGDVECGCGPGDTEGDCRQWNRHPEKNSEANRSPGYKEPTGFGIITAAGGKVTIAHNKVSYTTKYAIDCYADQESAKANDLCRVHENDVDHGEIMAGTYFSNAWISNNRSVDSGLQGSLAVSAKGISSNGQGRRLWVIGNTVTGAKGPGIGLQDWLGYPGVRRALRIENNSISSSGDWTASQGSWVSTLFTWNGLVTPCSMWGGNYRREAEIIGNTIASNTKGNGSLVIQDTGQTCPGSEMGPLTIKNNDIYKPNWTGKDIARITGYDIDATGNALRGSAVWYWKSGSTGSCSGFSFYDGASVTDQSGNGIGTCP